MATRKKQPLPDLYLPPTFTAYASTDMGLIWANALDMLLPELPLDLLTIFRIIGPDGAAFGDKRAEAAQNLRIAVLLGYDVNLYQPNRKGVLVQLQRMAGLRSVQRYRKMAAGGGGQMRGGSPRRFRELYNTLAPIAFALILARFYDVLDGDGLGGRFPMWYVISPKKQKKPRLTQVEGGSDDEKTQAYVTPNLRAHNVDAAADEWILAAITSWGLGDAAIAALEIQSVEDMTLWIGYPDEPEDINPEDSETWWYDEDRARFVPGRGPDDWSIAGREV